MRSPATVSVDNYLTAGETSVALWPTNDETSRGLNLRNMSENGLIIKKVTQTDVVDSPLVKELGGNDLLDDLV